MEAVPDIWRTALWHPLVVHFPIGLLVFATLTRLVWQFVKKGHDWILKMSRVLLYSGTLLAWLAVYTGSMADAEVVRTLCDPTVVEAHENSAYIVGWIFLATSLIDLLSIAPWQIIPGSFQGWKEWLVILVLLVGTGYLTYTAHLGAKLVYQQGAAVYHPTEDCSEFE